MQKNISKDIPHKNGVLHVWGNNALLKHFLPDGPALVVSALEERNLSGEFRLTLIEQARGSHHTRGLRGGIAKASGLELYIQPGENGSRRKALLTRLNPRLSELSERVEFYKRLEGDFKRADIPSVELPVMKEDSPSKETAPPEAPPQESGVTPTTLLSQSSSARKFSARDDTDIILLRDEIKERHPSGRFTYADILLALSEAFKEDTSEQEKYMSVVRSLLARGLIVKHERSVYGFPVPGASVPVQVTSGVPKAKKRAEAKPGGDSIASGIVNLEEELAELEGKADPAREVKLRAKVADVDSKIGDLRDKRNALLQEIAECDLSSDDKVRVEEIKQKLASIRALLG